jgi:hypothetical protein
VVDALRVQSAKDGGYADPIIQGQSRHRLPIGMPFGNLSALTGIQNRRPAKLLALCLGALDSFLAPLSDNFSLELPHSPHDGEDQL